jgi:hypothetical protein
MMVLFCISDHDMDRMSVVPVSGYCAIISKLSDT